jgi:hypothetical protein
LHWEREIEGPTTIAGRPENHGPDPVWGMFAGTTIINHHAISATSLIVCLESFIFAILPIGFHLDSIKICVLVRQSREQVKGSPRTVLPARLGFGSMAVGMTTPTKIETVNQQPVDRDLAQRRHLPD